MVLSVKVRNGIAVRNTVFVQEYKSVLALASVVHVIDTGIRRTG